MMPPPDGKGPGDRNANDRRVFTAAAVGLCAALWTCACGDGATEPPPADPPRATTVEVTPATAELTALGETVRFAAQVLDQNGQTMAGAAVAWSSGDASVATVDAGGLATAVGNGTTKITATSGDARGNSEITVANPDRAALVALYEATDGPNWIDSEGWLTDAPLGEWYGVETDASGRVVRLEIPGRWDSEAGSSIPHGLTGPIPPEVGNLSRLTKLDLHHNNLRGPIPPALGSLANLQELDLGYNPLGGAIPPALGSLVNLHSLVLRYSLLEGPIPPELGNLANLEGLDLAANRLSGSIPAEMGGLRQLWSFQAWDNELTGSIPAELGNLTRLRSLHLGYNDLTGSLPPELGTLANLMRLSLNSNNLMGPIPTTFLQLQGLSGFYIDDNESLCVPGTSAFVAWLQRIEGRDEESTRCNAADVAALESLFEATGGADWTNSTGWLGDGAVEEWHGVGSDSLGHVTELDLARNGLAGKIPHGLADLVRMTVLRIGGNALSGRLPLSLTRLPLREFRYADTDLCAPARKSFRTWLGGIGSHEGTGVPCAPLSDREILEILYDATDGTNWTEGDNWLTDAPLREWRGVETDGEGRVNLLDLTFNYMTGTIPDEVGSLARLEYLSFFGNEELTGPIPPTLGSLVHLEELHLSQTGLTGPIPPELGNLTHLKWLGLSFSNLSGPIPPELGKLSQLTEIRMWRAGVEGPIPPELGNLGNLKNLGLGENALTGPIPPELGRLSRLETLYLTRNAMTGSVPAELGNLAKLERLSLDQNDLAGPIPPELGRLTNLKELGVANNARMSGVLPGNLTSLRSMESFVTTGTDLCAPSNPAFQAWLAAIRKRRIASCNAGDAAAAYLVQAVQSREFPVPLVAGERALLRVFPTATRATTEGIPPVRAGFYLNGREVHVEDIPGKSTPIPTEVTEGSLAASVYAEIQGHVVQPGLEMVIEVDPNGTLDAGLGVVKRIPETGRAPVDVYAMPTLDLTVVPFLWTEDPDSAILEITRGMEADPENHEMLWATRALLPVSDMVVRAHEPVLTTTNHAGTFFGEMEAIRALEGGTAHWMAMMSGDVVGPGGFAVGNRLNFSRPYAEVIAHELGHNMSLDHAPCGPVAGIDLGFPYPDGTAGVWGWDFRSGGGLVPPGTPDLMSYCAPEWVSDYHFTNALRYRLTDEAPPEAVAAADVTRGLLLWGGIDADTVPYLEPAFVVDAPPALPDSAGAYTVTGRTAGGAELFSLSFAMPETFDGDGSSSFAFVLPVRAAWERSLATVTLAGPGGSFTLDGNSDLAMAVLRNSRTGQVRGILRDPPAGLLTQGAADAAGALAPGVEMLFSRGIPETGAWRR